MLIETWQQWLFPTRRLQAKDVLDERIHLESVSTSIGAVGIMLIACVTYLIFPMDMPQSHYMGHWLASQLVINSFWLAFIAYHARYKHDHTKQLWPYFSTIVCSFNGFIWGAGWVFFVGDATIEQAQAAVIFTIILGGVFTGGVLATIFHLPSLVSFMLCSLLPALVGTIVDDGIFHLWFGITIIVYMLACTAFALNLHGFLMDTLEQREEKALLAQQLAEEKQRAELASLEKTRFLAAASHDLRQPLQALQFFQYSLGEILTSNPQEQHIIEGMVASISALNGLLNAMLDVAQLDAGKQTVRKQVFPLNTLFRRIRQQYEPLAAEAGLALRYISTSAYVNTDPMLLERITQNLVHNAIKHMGGRGRILIGGRRQGNCLRIEIRDGSLCVSGS
ncbi:MAG: HAMP domain-containing histidine kinase [Gammaproteobacteria bacterium]|nr:HAMP domain-containing histidine kinase [Gammaproteobacteria bacterium]